MFQAARTNGDAGNFVEGLLTDAALIGEYEIDKAADYPRDGALSAAGHCKSASDTGEQATREDPPPPKKPVYNTECYARISMQIKQAQAWQAYGL